MSKTMKLAVLAMLACVLGAPCVQAGPRGEMRDQGPMRERMRQELGITAEQAEKLDKNRLDNAQKMKEIGKQLREKRKAFGEALRDASTKTAELKKLHKEIKELSGKMQDVMFDGMLKVREILDKDQLAKFHKLMDRRMKMTRERGMKMGDRMGERMRERGGGPCPDCERGGDDELDAPPPPGEGPMMGRPGPDEAPEADEAVPAKENK